MSRKYITLKQLREAQACASARETFELLFGSRVYVSKKRAIEATEAGLSIDWAAWHLLSEDARAEYRRSYERNRRNAWAKCSRRVEEAWKELRLDFEADGAWTEYEREAADARAEYRHSKVDAFVRLYRED